tara:strand:- start:164 stop:301 length:138 start_codon:yes stop_codon:yes gene_type:complete
LLQHLDAADEFNTEQRIVSNEEISQMLSLTTTLREEFAFLVVVIK